MQSPHPIGPVRSAFESHVVVMRAFRASALLLSKSVADKGLAKRISGRHSAAAFGEMLSDLD